MRLLSVNLANYRSFGGAQNTIKDFGKVNIFIGKNNSGKSNILKAINTCKSLLAKEGALFKIEDYFEETKERGIALTYGFDLEAKYAEFFAFLIENLKANSNNFSRIYGTMKDERINAIIQIGLSDRKVPHNTRSWFTSFAKDFMDKTGEVHKNYFEEPGVTNFVLNQLGSAINQNRIVDVPDMRRITKGEVHIPDGTGLPSRLAKMPIISKEHGDEERKRLDDIVSFLRTILEDDTIELAPDEGEETVFVISKKSGPRVRRDVRNLGAGISELILMAFRLAYCNSGIVTIEEPEIHMHPKFLRDFLRFIAYDPGDNQYFISTHSNVLLDFGIPKKVFEVIHDGYRSIIEPIEGYEAMFQAVRNIGNRPSDILQSNCVIWVEGPTDRIYISKWISLLDKKIKEGLHYTFVYYGGACLSHIDLKPEDKGKCLDDLLDILNVSRNCIIVMDSDLEKDPPDPSKPVGDTRAETKLAIQKKCKSAERFCWITAGREIENYISDPAIKKVFNRFGELGKYKKLGITKDARGTSGYIKKKGEKAKEIAEAMTKESEFENPKYDLKERLEEIVAKIKEYNQINS